MDISYTSEFDAKHYGRLIRRALALVAIRKSVAWCMLVAGFVLLFATWIAGENAASMSVMKVGFFLIFFPLILWMCRRLAARQYVKVVSRIMGGETTSQCHLTDGGYEVTCGEMSQKTPWKNLGTHYHFFDGDTVVLLQPNGTPSVVLCDLREHGIDRAELEAVFRKSEMKSLGESKKRKVWFVLSCVVGAIFIAIQIPYLMDMLASRQGDLRFEETRLRLFDLVHGKDDPRRPRADDSMSAKVVRALTGDDEPDEVVYLFDPKGEDDKVGLFVRYGNRGYRTYLPCGGTVCSSVVSAYEYGEAKAPTEEWYAEADKEKWLEKVRPIAKELYEDASCEVCD